MNSILETIFWVSILMPIYVYAGFPTLLRAIGLVWSKAVRRAEGTPRVTLVIAAYNEERSIRKKLENSLALDYPRDCLEIIVASDGSDDDTESIASGFSPDVTVLSLPRRGKIHALNDAVERATGEVLVFTDANTDLSRSTLRAIAENFADPEVGGVVGNKVYSIESGSESVSHGESLYCRYDRWLKKLESALGSAVSGDGALYAIRRSLYPYLTEMAVTDDFAISTAVVDQGFRLVFEERAQVSEVALAKSSREFSRKVRMMTRGLRSILVRRDLLNPLRSGMYSLSLLSHKVLRRLIPVFLISLYLSSLVLAGSEPVYAMAAAAQTVFYLAALAGLLLKKAALGGSKALFIPFYFCLANLAALIALVNLLRGRRIERWVPQRHLSRTYRT